MTDSNQKLKEQNEYLRRQLSKAMKLEQRVLESPSRSNLDEVSIKSQHSEFKRDVEPRRTPRREWYPTSNSNDFRVEIPEFEGKPKPDEFLEWLHTVK